MTFFCKDIVLGKDMHPHALFRFAATLRARDILEKMKSFASNDSLRVGMLYGLRRTGKSVLLRQWLLALPHEEQERAAYITIDDESMADVKKDLSTLHSHGYKYVVVDEITACPDFIDCSAALANKYAGSGMKLFICGTDSLSLWLALTDGLFDREYTLHTTHNVRKDHSIL